MMRLALATLMACPALASAQTPIVLSKPDAEYAEPFSVIAGVRALKDGRVIVSDSRDRIVLLVDFRGRAVTVGSTGKGPGEYLAPSAIAALPGDTSALWDGGNQRYLVITPNGTPGGDFRLTRAGGGGYGAFAATLPRGVDARGNIYFQGSPFVTRPDGPAPADSVPVIMLDRARQRPDTVAFVRPARGNASVTAVAGGGVNITNGRANPLLPLDEWAVLPDGRVAVVRGDSYRVDFYVAGAVKTSGPAAPYERVVVDDGVKRMITEQRKRQIESGRPRTGPTGQESRVPPEILKQLLNLEPWPARMPAFRRGAVIARPLGDTGQIWVLRAKRSEAAPSLYDVFNETGRLVARVQFPARTEVAAFGPDVAYVLRTDDDDLQYLQRYRLPAF